MQLTTLIASCRVPLSPCPGAWHLPSGTHCFPPLTVYCLPSTVLCKSATGWNLPSPWSWQLTADSRQLVVSYVQRSSLRLLPATDSLLPFALSVPRVLTPEFRPADFAAWMGSASRRWETCLQAWLHPTVTLRYCINLYYGSQDKYAIARGYKMSLPKIQGSAALFCRSAALLCP